MKKNKVFILVSFICISIFLTSFFVLETDYFWHIKAGEYMFKNGPLTHDVFSWFTYGKYWMSHEWLFEVILYIFKLVFGNIHVIIYCFVAILSLFLILFFGNKDKLSKNIYYDLFYFMMFVLLSFGYVQARPHLFSYSFLALSTYLCIDLYNNKDSKKIFFLPLISILWANMHGGSSNMSYIIPSIFLVSGLFSFKFKKIESNRISKKQIYRYILIIILCMVGICINIHGIKLLIYPYINMMDTTMLNNISEWQPTSLKFIYHYYYYVFLLFVLITMIISSKKIRFIDIILFMAFAFLGLKSIRFWLYLPIVMSFIIFDYVKEVKLSKYTLPIFYVLLVGLLGFSIYNFKNVNLTYNLNIDKELIEVLNEQKPKRLFNMYNYGGELIYHDVKVFVDGRADLYSKYNYKDYIDMSLTKGNYKQLFEKYNFDYYLLSKDYSVYDYIMGMDGIQVLYEDNDLVLIKK